VLDYTPFTLHPLISARITLRLGQMPSIDLAFADAPWPSPGPDHIPTTDFGVIPCFRYHLEMTKLADLLGRACESGEAASLTRLHRLRLT
jgi:hypothetical protein